MTSYIAEALRQRVSQRAKNRCEYCGIHVDDVYFRHEIDHIYAEKHGGSSTENNLCLACADCNRNKGSDLYSLDELTGTVVSLFHPRNDLWQKHFKIAEVGLILYL